MSEGNKKTHPSVALVAVTLQSAYLFSPGRYHVDSGIMGGGGFGGFGWKYGTIRGSWVGMGFRRTTDSWGFYGAMSRIMGDDGVYAEIPGRFGDHCWDGFRNTDQRIHGDFMGAMSRGAWPTRG